MRCGKLHNERYEKEESRRTVFDREASRAISLPLSLSTGPDAPFIQNGPDLAGERLALPAFKDQKRYPFPSETMPVWCSRLGIDLRHRVRTVKVNVKPDAIGIWIRDTCRPSTVVPRTMSMIAIINRHILKLNAAFGREVLQLGKFIVQRRYVIGNGSQSLGVIGIFRGIHAGQER